MGSERVLWFVFAMSFWPLHRDRNVGVGGWGEGEGRRPSGRAGPARLWEETLFSHKLFPSPETASGRCHARRPPARLSLWACARGHCSPGRTQVALLQAALPG